MRFLKIILDGSGGGGKTPRRRDAAPHCPAGSRVAATGTVTKTSRPGWARRRPWVVRGPTDRRTAAGIDRSRDDTTEASARVI